MLHSTCSIASTASAALAIALLLSADHNLNASVILSPTAVIQNTLGQVGGIFLTSAIDQSGLNPKFESGTTDFDTFVAESATHFSQAEFEWFAEIGVTSGAIDWDLGESYLVDRIAIWNEDATGVKDMTVLTSNDPSFSSFTEVGQFTLMDTDGGVLPLGTNFYPGEVISLTTTQARYVRFDIQTAYPNDPGNLTPTTASLGEVAFSVTPVPESNQVPATLAFCGVALLIHRSAARRKLRRPYTDDSPTAL